MLTKTMMALAALALFTAPAVQAGSKDDGPAGGYRFGPLGQVFSVPPGMPRNAYGYLPPNGTVAPGYNAYGSYYGPFVGPRNRETYIRIQDQSVGTGD